MGISLDYNGKSYVSSTKLTTGDVWKLGETRTVGIGLFPGTNQAADEKGTSETVTAVDRLTPSVTLPVHYDEARGWYTVDMDALKDQGSWLPGVARDAQFDVLSRGKIRLSNPEASAKALRVNFQLASNFSITGVSPMLRDLEGNPLGIPVQLSKDWHVTPGLMTPYQGPWLHGFTVFHLPPKSSTEFECAIAFAHWGGVAAAAHAQLSLVGYSINQEWDQSSLGSWGESICYDPDVATGPCMICDVRPLMVTGWGGDKWNWSNAVGGGDFLVYFDSNNKRQYLSRMKWAFTSQCPNLTDVTYSGITADGVIRGEDPYRPAPHG